MAVTGRRQPISAAGKVPSGTPQFAMPPRAAVVSEDWMTAALVTGAVMMGAVIASVPHVPVATTTPPAPKAAVVSTENPHPDLMGAGRLFPGGSGGCCGPSTCLKFNQTDTASVDAVAGFCSSRAAGVVSIGRTAAQGGAQGTGTPLITIPGPTTTKVYVQFETAANEMNGLTVPAGTWTIPLSITTADTSSSITIVEAWICRVNSAGVSQQTIGSNTSLAVNPDSVRVLSMSVTGVATTFAAGDRIVFLLVMGNTDSVSHSFNFTPNQVIAAPCAVVTPNRFPPVVAKTEDAAPDPGSVLIGFNRVPSVVAVPPGRPAVTYPESPPPDAGLVLYRHGFAQPLAPLQAKDFIVSSEEPPPYPGSVVYLANRTLATAAAALQKPVYVVAQPDPFAAYALFNGAVLNGSSLSKGPGKWAYCSEYDQTDVTAADGAKMACAGGTMGPGAAALQVYPGGARGSIEFNLTNTAPASTLALLMFESNPGNPGVANWPAGPWSVGINVSVANAAMSWDRVSVCRMNAAGVSVGTVGGLQSMGKTLGQTGVYVATFPGVASTGAASDRFYVVLQFTNAGNSGGAQTIRIRPDQAIFTPICGTTTPQTATWPPTSVIHGEDVIEPGAIIASVNKSPPIIGVQTPHYPVTRSEEAPPDAGMVISLHGTIPAVQPPLPPKGLPKNIYVIEEQDPYPGNAIIARARVPVGTVQFALRVNAVVRTEDRPPDPGAVLLYRNTVPYVPQFALRVNVMVRTEDPPLDALGFGWGTVYSPTDLQSANAALPCPYRPVDCDCSDDALRPVYDAADLTASVVDAPDALRPREDDCCSNG